MIHCMMGKGQLTRGTSIGACEVSYQRNMKDDEIIATALDIVSWRTRSGLCYRIPKQKDFLRLHYVHSFLNSDALNL